ncbi:D-alanyl-D-alanine carboxypeptidase/D-alanyl-D-alanine-endopeptidase [Paucisalibacillus sp. EB02]|uniref:D-alanyl-D-alanine carboxypeptidase/D-alanyl-D-alanine endopeptidase n=1 Tax=Paucisalibacillus sp. EB02 TaxID=1347087 RepID=UPI0004BCB686|nr:D-alanyl-D-alanine carboxypeptidase/D-alanyl-D-alanine-endopeptidase [Paucisalibacillus sp. EB02]
MDEKWRNFQEFMNKEPKLQGALAGISIRSRETGQLLYEHMGDTRLHPASNMKIFSCASGFAVLGENYTFSTEIWIDGEIKDNTLNGNLYIKGKGDPTLLPQDFKNLAQVIKEKGIQEIKGNIIGDDTWYDDVRLSQDLNWNDEHYYYGAQVSALTVSPNEDYDTGTIMLAISPGNKVGDKPVITLTPLTNYIKIINKAVTTESNGEEDEAEITVIRQHGNNDVVVEGRLPIYSASLKEWVAVWEPTDYALELFQNALKKIGISNSGKVIRGVTPKQANLLYVRESISLSDLSVPFMKLSNNGHGEMIVKELGKVVKGEGSWDCGLNIMEETLEKLGVDTSNLIIRDGSGISHVTVIPPNEISKFLFRIQKEPWFNSFYRSLPVAGDEDRMVGGTLNDRMYGLEVNAKTGTIMGVSTLSGYLKTKEGEELIFSIMLNNLLDEEDGPGIIDNLVEYIVTEKSKTIVS